MINELVRQRHLPEVFGPCEREVSVVWLSAGLPQPRLLPLPGLLLPWHHPHPAGKWVAASAMLNHRHYHHPVHYRL
jgi:hypothetical protein